MKKGTVEFTVGVFVLIGLVCVAYLTIRLGRMEVFSGDSYTLEARFQSVAGLKNGASVEISGVQVGKVNDIHLDLEDKVAVVTLKLDKRLQLSDDTIASVKTSGLIGDKYINLSPGGSDVVLKPGGRVKETQSAVDLEELISKYVFGKV